jgi:hypothetical protein
VIEGLVKLDRLVKLEKQLARMLDRKLRDPDGVHDPLELVPLILDHVEEHVLPTSDGGRAFPYDRVTVQVAVPAHRSTAARTVLEHPPGLAARIQLRLREVGCAESDLKVITRVVEGPPPEDWGAVPFRIEYRERKSLKPRTPPPAEIPRVRLVVTSGAAGARTHEFELQRINVGRLSRVEGRAPGSVRHNHLAFADDGSEVNATVSRAHAHIEHQSEGDHFLLFDDGSAHGTRVLRGGRSIVVPRQGSRGVRVQDGDQLEFGSARVQFVTRAPAARRGSAKSTG